MSLIEPRRNTLHLSDIQTVAQPHGRWDTLVGIGIIFVAIALLWLLNRVLTHYFPSIAKVRTSAGNALMRAEATFLPGREHVMEAMERDDAENDEQGDPPETGDEK